MSEVRQPPAEQEPFSASQEPPGGRRGRELKWIGLSYFAEGLPWSLLHQVAAEFFTAIGARPSQVSRTALLHIPILLKIVFSSIVERYLSLRSWMWGSQALMGALMGLVSLLAGLIESGASLEGAIATALWAILFGIGLLSAVYDIACDGFYLQNLGEQKQAAYSGIRVAVYRVAMLVGSFGLVFVGGAIHWRFSFGLGGVILLLLSLLIYWLLPQERLRGGAKPGALRLRREGTAREAYRSFFQQNSMPLVLLFLFSYKAADAMMFSMSSVLLSRQLGIETELRAIRGVFSTIASIAGAIWGGAWVARRGLERAFFPITLLMVVTEPLYALLSYFSQQLALPSIVDLRASEQFSKLAIVTAVIVIEKLCAGLAVAAQTIFIMRRCHPDHKTAHYAFATVVYSVAQIVLGLLSGYLFEGLGPQGYYILVSVLALPSLLLVRLLPMGQRLS